MKNSIQIIPSDLPIYWTGPALAQGPLPAFFYFALSGEESLSLDPFNQPITYLKDSPIRCFSFTLPYHGLNLDPNTAIESWKTDPKSLDVFFENCLKNFNFLIDNHIVDPEKMSVGGLSRGAFVAAHLAAQNPRLKFLLGFAPLTTLVSSLDLSNLIEKLVHTHVRFYIGNRDLRVDTENCFNFIYQLADAAYHHGHRSPPIELIISPSTGFKGHGTLPPIFQNGAQWIHDNLT